MDEDINIEDKYYVIWDECVIGNYKELHHLIYADWQIFADEGFETYKEAQKELVVYWKEVVNKAKIGYARAKSVGK